MRGLPEQNRAAEKLRLWESGSRDDAVREAAAAGLSLARMQQITGLGMTTIMRILNSPPRPRARSTPLPSAKARPVL